MIHSNPGKERAALADDLQVPRTVSITDTDALGGRAIIEVDAVFDDAYARYRSESVRLVRADVNFEIDGQALRAVRVQELMQLGLRQAVDFEVAGGERWAFPLPADLSSFVVKSGPSSTAAMEWVARIYRLAAAINLPATKAVRDQLGLTAPTASVWIRRARDRGFLDELELPPFPEAD